MYTTYKENVTIQFVFSTPQYHHYIPCMIGKKPYITIYAKNLTTKSLPWLRSYIYILPCLPQVSDTIWVQSVML